MSQSDDDQWTYEVESNTVICDQRGWNDASPEELRRLMQQFEELASRESATASMTVMDPDAKVGAETQEFLEQNSPVYERLGITKVALVSDGIQGMAIKSLVDSPPETEIETFDDREAALEWCKTSQ